MAGLNKIDTFFGIHGFSAVNKTTKQAYGAANKGNGIIKVLKSGAIKPNQALVSLTGGSFAGPVAVERGASDIQIALRLAEYPSWLFELAGWIHTPTAAETSGNASATFVNSFGTSLKNATTGVASASITTAADLKTGLYLLVAVTTTTVDVYALGDLDFKGNGTALSYQDASLKITATPLTITATTAVAIPGTGLSITGGSGTIGMTAGDVAILESRKINIGSDNLVLTSNPVPIEFEAHFFFQKQSDGEIQRCKAFRCVIPSMEIPMNEKQFAETDLNMMLMLDPATDSYLSIDRIRTAA